MFRRFIKWIRSFFVSNVELNRDESVRKIGMQSIDYHPKIILAWVQGLEGNIEILSWLKENGYEELVYASSAIHLRKEAREWLMDNGYPQLMALINASEGNKNALQWLKINKMDVLYYMALAIDNDIKGWEWLKKNSSEDIFLLAKTINTIKNGIEERHNDIHSYGID